MNAEEVAQTFMAGKALEVKAGGETFHIISEEVEVKAQAKAGFAVAEDGAYVAALVTDLTPELAVRRSGARIPAPRAGSAQDRRPGCCRPHRTVRRSQRRLEVRNRSARGLHQRRNADVKIILCHSARERIRCGR